MLHNLHAGETVSFIRKALETRTIPIAIAKLGFNGMILLSHAKHLAVKEQESWHNMIKKQITVSVILLTIGILCLVPAIEIVAWIAMQSM